MSKPIDANTRRRLGRCLLAADLGFDALIGAERHFDDARVAAQVAARELRKLVGCDKFMIKTGNLTDT